MASTLGSSALRTPVKAVHSALDDIRAGDANLRMDAKSAAAPAGFGPFRALVREAMRRAQMSQKVFAIDAKQPESVISEAFSGTRPLAAEWIGLQTSAAFRRHLVDVLREAWALDAEATQDAEDRVLIEVFAQTLLRARRRTA